MGITANIAFADDVKTEASSDNNPGDDLVGFKKIEDGSVASNIHTAKWRVFTDKAREFFVQACSFFLLRCFKNLFSLIIFTALWKNNVDYVLLVHVLLGKTR